MGKLRILLFIFATSCSQVPISDMVMSSQTPVPGKPESIGYYSSGCLKGAVSLPASGKGFSVMRTSRGRFWGHPDLIDFIEKIAIKTLNLTGDQLLIGDLGHARGGPSLIGHNSHQTGLDVDIWFKSLDNGQKLTLGERETLNADSFLNLDKSVDNSKWNNKMWKIMKLITSNKKVQRVFVNPSIKKLICDNKDISKLNTHEMAKIRPWYRHEDHFHVRLHCPENSNNCTEQKPVGEGDGCDETLAWWFTEEGQEKIESIDYYDFYKKRKNLLPEACKELINSH